MEGARSASRVKNGRHASRPVPVPQDPLCDHGGEPVGRVELAEIVAESWVNEIFVEWLEDVLSDAREIVAGQVPSSPKPCALRYCSAFEGVPLKEVVLRQVGDPSSALEVGSVNNIL